MPTLSSLLETKVFVSGATFLVLAYKRDVQSAAFLLGAVSNALFSKILKRLINASRPQGAQLSDPGMPSSHAQSLFFFAGYLGTGAMLWPSLQLEPAVRLAAAGATVALASTLTLLRVHAGLHTLAQVAVGACIGAVNGTLMLLASPAVEERLSAFVSHVGTKTSSGLAAGLLVAGVLVVGSVERVVAARLKKKG